MFLRYSSTKKEYRCFNKRLHKIVESADVKLRKEKNLDSIENTCDDEIKDLKKDESIHNEEEDKEREDTQEYNEDFPRPDTKTPSRRIQKDHLESQITGDKKSWGQNKKTTTRCGTSPTVNSRTQELYRSQQK